MIRTLENKTILITGAATGVGQQMAITLSKLKAKIAIHFNKTTPNETIRKIQKIGGEYIACHSDFSQGICSALEMYTKVEAAFGKVDILINNAAVLHNGEIIDISEQDYDETFLVNTKVPYFLCKQAIKSMPDGGKIINISSGGTKMILEGYSTYLASKAALEQITRSLTIEAAKRKITINSIALGATNTKMVRCFSDEQLAILAAMTPLQRIGTTEDIAKIIEFLCSSDSDWITGQTIYANGGLI
jgi:3-oxoacyl-[acyl-carrier protein] reductase